MTNSILKQDNIVVGAQAKSKQEAIEEAGTLLADRGYVTSEYVAKMHEREELTSTFMGNMLAIPHGTEEAKGEVKESGISILLYNNPIDWDGNDVRIVIGIAGKGNEHLDILSKIAIACSEEENVEKLLESKSSDEVLSFFSEVNE